MSENKVKKTGNSVSPVQNAEFVKAMKEAKNVDTADLRELTGAAFIDFDKLREKHKTNQFHFAFVGFTPYQDKKTGEEKEVVKLITEEGDEVLNSDAVMLSSMRKWQDKNPGAETVIIRVTYNGETKTTADGKGSYRLLQIHSF